MTWWSGPVYWGSTGFPVENTRQCKPRGGGWYSFRYFLVASQIDTPLQVEQHGPQIIYYPKRKGVFSNYHFFFGVFAKFLGECKSFDSIPCNNGPCEKTAKLLPEFIKVSNIKYGINSGWEHKVLCHGITWNFQSSWKAAFSSFDGMQWNPNRAAICFFGVTHPGNDHISLTPIHLRFRRFSQLHVWRDMLVSRMATP